MGKAELRRIWEGSILVKFFGEELKILSMTSSENVNDQPFKYKYKYNPRAERKIMLAGRSFYKFRLDHAVFPNQLSWHKKDSAFTKLSLQFLETNGASMAQLAGDGLFCSWVTSREIDKSVFPSLYGKRDQRIKTFGLISG